jgi:ABC-type sugar transport system ATPase subunit
VYEGIRESCALGAGALIVSLDVEELQTFCDRIYVMNRGVLREAKTKDLAEIGPMMVD